MITMVTKHIPDHNEDDAPLNAHLRRWQTPSLSPGFAARTSALLLEQRAKRDFSFPWSPMKLAAATAAAAMVGILLGVAMPSSDAVADTTDIIEQLW
jgi:hypothetical protein